MKRVLIWLPRLLGLVFLTEFFMVQGSQADDIFFLVFGRTLGLLQKSVEDYVATSYDCIALFLCCHLTVKFREMSREKGVNAMDRYWDSILAILWPKLQKVIQSNVQSVKDCDPQKMKSLDLRPHYVSFKEYSIHSSKEVVCA